MKKPAIPSIYFIKALCALGIIVYHFAMQMTNVDVAFAKNFANGNWGSCFVTTFFVVSGFILHYHYGDNLELRKFYIKRWRGLFPMFYLAYLFYMVQKFFDNRSLFYKGHPLTYLLTLIGMDGYTMNRINNYYILGEWFLGAIILMYLLYPLVLHFFKKNSIASFAVIAALYGLFYEQPITNANPFWTISSCLVSFCFGMLFSEYRSLFTSRGSVLVCGAGFLVLTFVPLPAVLENLCTHLEGIFLFILLTVIGERIMKKPPVNRVFRELGILSYPIFLVHNQVIIKISLVFQPQTLWKAAVLLALAIGLILPWAKVLSIVTDAVMKKADALLACAREHASV